MRKHRRIPSESYEFIVEEARYLRPGSPDWNAAAIQRKLRERFPRDTTTLPTVRDIMREAAARDDSVPWSLIGADDEAAAFLPKVLVELAVRSEGRTQSLTRREADWVMRVKRAAPPLPPTSAWLLAREFMRHEDAGQDTAHLDLSLAIAAALGAPFWAGVGARDEELIAAHVRAHARAWLDRKFSAWTGSAKRYDLYMAEAGRHGSFAGNPLVVPDDWYIEFWWQPGGKKEEHP